MNTGHAELAAIFARNNLRLTMPRQLIFDTLKHASEPLLASSIAKQCPAVDKTSVYRTLELFSKLQIVTTVPLGWKIRYELTGPFKSHHHHLHCTSCDTITDIHSGQIESLIAQIATEHSFAPSDHQFEINGLCAKCRIQPIAL